MKILFLINFFLKEIKHYKIKKMIKIYNIRFLNHSSNNELFILLVNIILIISLIYPISSLKIKKEKLKLCFNSEIIIKVKDSNTQEIINKDFLYKPDEVYHNGKSITLLDGNKVENLDYNNNTILMRWHDQLITCQNMFANITSIEEVDLSNFNFSKVSSTEQMFYKCVGIKYIHINNSLDLPFLSAMNSMFYYAQSLLFLDLSKFDTSHVKNMDYLFAECHSLTSLNISSIVTSSCLSMKYLFFNCGSLRALDLSNFNTTLVTSMQDMFKNCQTIQSLDLSSFRTNSVVDMQFMFNNCGSLLSLNLYNFNTSLVTNMNQMFSNCNSMTSLNISNFNTKSVNNMQYMFYGCNSLRSLDLSSFDSSLVTDMRNMFSSCNSLTSLNLHNFNTSSVINMKNMFNLCHSLRFLDISNFNTSLINDTKDMFSNCNSLTSLNLSSFDTSSVETMEKMFYNCFSLTSLNISNFDTSLVTNMMNMFEGCVSLLYLNIKNFTINASMVNTDMFKNIYENIIYCLEDSANIDKIKSLLNEKECSYNDCSDNWEKNIYSISRGLENYIKIFNGKCDYTKIKDMNHNFITSDNMSDNTYVYLYNINSDINIIKEINYNLTFIDFTSENIENLKKQFNLDEEIYILISVFPSNEPQTATSDYNFKLLLESGKELNLSFINTDFYVNVYVPIIDLNSSKYNYAAYFVEQGFDILNKHSNFYYDNCLSAYYIDNDIIIKDRIKEIFPNNITLCKSNCKYKNVNIKEKRISCECNLNTNKYKNANELNNDNNILEVKEENENFGDLLLKNINYKIFKCSHLIFSFKNLKDNIGFYLLSIVFILMLIFNIKFFFFGLSNLRVKMFEEVPTKEKIKSMLIEQLSKRRKKRHVKIINNPIRKKVQFKTITPSKIYKNNVSITYIHKNKNTKYKKSSKKIHSTDYSSSSRSKSPFKKINKALNNYINKIKEKNYEIYNNLPYTRAIINDHRSALQLFESILLQKFELIHLIMTKTKVKDILVCEYILSLLIDFFFNTFFYSDDIISHKYHNNGKLKFAVALIITISSNIATSIICHFLNHSNWIEEKIENILEIRIEYKYLFLLNKFLKFLKIKMILFLICEIIIFVFCFYYVVIFCSVFTQTQISLLINYFASLLEGVAKSIIVSILIVITRKIGINYLNIYSYNISKYLNEHF